MPAIEHTIRTYAEMRQELGHPGKLLVIWGEPGLGKTHLLRECLPADAVFFDRLITPKELEEVASGRLTSTGGRLTVCSGSDDETDDRLIVLDDVWEKRHAPSVVHALDKGRQFVLVTNNWQKTSPIIRAVGSRGVVLRFEPSAKEVHLEIARAGWFRDQEVYDFFFENLSSIQLPDMRQYSTLAERKASGLPWREVFWSWHGQDEQERVIALYLGMKDLTMNQRAKAFQKDGHGTERTFWRQKDKFLANRSEADFQNPSLAPVKKRRRKA